MGRGLTLHLVLHSNCVGCYVLEIYPFLCILDCLESDIKVQSLLSWGAVR